MTRKNDFSAEDLTPRQREVLVMIGRGMSYSAAAARLRNKDTDCPGISPRTVEEYAARIRDMMGVPWSPTKALMIYYLTHREELEDAA